MLDTDKKLEQYETTAVEVANEMHNSNVRAENSKTIIESFPNVRLASENKTKKVEGRGRNFLPSLLLSAIVGTACFGLGYNIRQHNDNSQRMYTIDELITQDLSRNKSFSFTGDFDFFTETYALRILNLRASDYVLSKVKEYFKKYTDPTKPNTINYNGGGK